MTERCAVITGAARGIGRATVEAFVEAGWYTIGVDASGGEGWGAHRMVVLDVADPKAATELIAGIESQEGRLDALVNNAAVQLCKPLVETSLEEWDRLMSVNLCAPFWFLHEAAALLERSKGAVVNVSSVHAVATSPGLFAYATSKGALATLTRAAALELAPRGVRVNAVLPGAVDTSMLREGLSREHLGTERSEDPVALFGEQHPLGRVARPAEIAQAILYLADSERSSYVTGHSLVVDGGVTSRLSTE